MACLNAFNSEAKFERKTVLAVPAVFPYFRKQATLRLNPKSLIGVYSRLWHRVKVDSGIGLPIGKCVGVE